jgi:hypothetical protein
MGRKRAKLRELKSINFRIILSIKSITLNGHLLAGSVVVVNGDNGEF